MYAKSRFFSSAVAFLLTLSLCLGLLPASADSGDVAWDLIDHSMAQSWDTDGWSLVHPSQPVGKVTQKDGYVNVYSDTYNSPSQYVWMVNRTALPAAGFTLEAEVRLNSPTAKDGGEISVRANQNHIGFFLSYGDESAGFVRSISSGNPAVYHLDTSVWHTYTLAVAPSANGFVSTLYVDGDSIGWTGQASGTYSGGDLIRIGADNDFTCDMDIRAFRLSSEIASYAPVGSVSEVTLDSAEKDEGQESILAVTANCAGYSDGTPAKVELVRAVNEEPVPSLSTTADVQGEKISAGLTLPAGLAAGRYFVKVSVDKVYALSGAFTVKPTRRRPVLPSFEADGYTVDLQDYSYNPTNEFNFPSIIDTRLHGLPDGSRPIARYYLFYAPHNDPGGICLMTANSLDGPWKEYASNPLVSNSWPGHYSVSHVSSGHVMWIEEQQKYIMYYHGENHQTRYAYSENLVDWEYGDVILNANDFSPTGAGLTECSYGRVFAYEVPGLGNKYIFTVMINNTANTRKIYWAHSEDGIHWTAVKTPLLSPSTDQGYDYKGNLSGAYFFTKDDRCFVVAHGSTGDMYLFEVGQGLNEEIHWGVFYDSSTGAPDYARAGAPCFIQDDDGLWHMFYEGGERLKANIVHARQTENDAFLLSQLVEKIDAQKLKEADYTAESWSVFSDALEKARAILADPDATGDDRNGALSALQDAYDKLVSPVVPAVIKGDMNQDNLVTIQDVMEACKVLARQSAGVHPTEEEMRRGDLDGDAAFTIGDVMEICKILARTA